MIDLIPLDITHEEARSGRIAAPRERMLADLPAYLAQTDDRSTSTRTTSSRARPMTAMIH